MVVRRKNVLIVDYNQNLINVLRLALDNEKILLITTTCMDKAERMLRNVSFDLVVIGIRRKSTRENEGFDMLAHIKRISQETKVIIMTAYGSPESEKEAYDKGAFLYLNKPFDLRLLEEHLYKLGLY